MKFVISSTRFQDGKPLKQKKIKELLTNENTEEFSQISIFVSLEV